MSVKSLKCVSLGMCYGGKCLQENVLLRGRNVAFSFHLVTQQKLFQKM